MLQFHLVIYINSNGNEKWKGLLNCCIISFGGFHGFWILCVDVSKQPVCSVSIGRVNKNNLGQIARVFLQVNVRSKEACASWKRRGGCPIEGTGGGHRHKWSPVAKQLCAGETALCRIEEEEPWDGREMACFRRPSPFFKQVQKDFPRFAEVQSTLAVHVVWVHFQFHGFPYPVFVERSSVSCSSINQDHIIILHVLLHIINHEHISITFAIIIRVALQEC